MRAGATEGVLNRERNWSGKEPADLEQDIGSCLQTRSMPVGEGRLGKEQLGTG